MCSSDLNSYTDFFSKDKILSIKKLNNGLRNTIQKTSIFSTKKDASESRIPFTVMA